MTGTARWRVDMHTHCCWSKDSRTPLAAQARGIRRANLDAVCVTDHDTIEGARRLREIADGFRVIVGEEISSADGDLIGLFLESAVPSGLSAEETVRRVHAQGGLVSVPHPFSRNRNHRIKPTALARIASSVDIVEVFNAREAFPADNRRAREWAAERGIPGGAGSDAHRAFEIGNAWIDLEPFAARDSFLAALRSGAPQGKLAGVGVHVLTRIDTWLNRLVGPVRK